MQVEDKTYVHFLNHADQPVWLPEMVALDALAAREPYDRKRFNSMLEDSNTHVMLAEVDGKLAGYVLYKVEDQEFRIKKLVKHPDYGDQPIAKSLMEVMVGKLKPDCLSRMTIQVYVDDTEMQVMLRDVFKFKPSRGGALKHNAFPDGGTALMMERDVRAPVKTLMVYDHSTAQQNAPEPEKPKEYKTRGEVLVAALPKLKSLTGMEWEVVKPNGQGGFDVEDISRFQKRDTDLRMRTKELVANPAAALGAIKGFLDGAQPKTHASRIQKAAKVDFPCEWIRAIHMERGRDGQLAEDFVRVLELPDLRGRDAATTPAARGRTD